MATPGALAARRFLLILVATLSPLSGFLACATRTHSPPSAGPLIVIATIEPLAQLVRELSDGTVRVVTLLPPGATPEAFTISPRQAVSISQAALIVGVGSPGLALESVVLGKTKAPTTMLSDLGRGDLPTTTTNSQALVDPHLWLSFPHLRAVAQALGKRLVELGVGEPALIEGRTARWLERLGEIESRAQLALGPFRGAQIFVMHPAWQPFLDSFGLEARALENEGKEPSPQDLLSWIEDARRAGVKTIFSQPGSPRHALLAAAREIGAQIVVLDPLAPNLLATLDGAALAFAADLGSRNSAKGPL